MIYEAIKAVLSELDDLGASEYGDEWDDKVRDELAVLEGSYGNLRDANRPLIDYSSSPTQAAYVFRYVIGHAEFVYEALVAARVAANAPLFRDKKIWVTSVGGGPGSELLGLVKYLSSANDEAKVEQIIYTAIDKESSWNNVVKLICAEAGKVIKADCYFDKFDVTTFPGSTPSLEDADLVVMSYFISEVAILPQSANVRANIEEILSSVSKGALVIYNDNDAYTFYSFFNGRISKAGKYNQFLDSQVVFDVTSPGYDDIFQQYVDDFDYRPKLRSKALFKALRRTA